MHHIVPRSQGGKNDRDNLVKLLPEEHLFIHFLRFKAFKLSSDLKAVKMSLNGFNNKKIFKCDDYIKLNKHIRIIYAFARSAYKEKRKGKWISDKGLDSISKSSRGKIVVKNAETGEIVGKVDRDHKNIKNGLWIHHTKGFVTVFDENNKKIRISVEERRKNKEKYKYIFNEPYRLC